MISDISGINSSSKIGQEIKKKDDGVEFEIQNDRCVENEKGFSNIDYFKFQAVDQV